MKDTISTRYTIRGDKDESLFIRRLQKIASSDDTRPTLTGLYVEGGTTWAADGFVAAAVPTPEPLEDMEGKIIEGSIPAGDFVADVYSIPGTYPNIREVMPDGEPEAVFTLNAKFIEKVLKLMGKGAVRFELHEDNTVVMRTGKRDGRECVYAIIMPMHDEAINTLYYPEK